MWVAHAQRSRSSASDATYDYTTWTKRVINLNYVSQSSKANSPFKLFCFIQVWRPICSVYNKSISTNIGLRLGELESILLWSLHPSHTFCTKKTRIGTFCLFIYFFRAFMVLTQLGALTISNIFAFLIANGNDAFLQVVWQQLAGKDDWLFSACESHGKQNKKNKTKTREESGRLFSSLLMTLVSPYLLHLSTYLLLSFIRLLPFIVLLTL